MRPVSDPIVCIVQFIITQYVEYSKGKFFMSIKSSPMTYADLLSNLIACFPEIRTADSRMQQNALRIFPEGIYGSSADVQVIVNHTGFAVFTGNVVA